MPTEVTFLSPSLPRRIASLLYDGLLLIAVLLFATFLFVILFDDATEPPRRYLLQVYLWIAAGVYFAWNWLHGGQTLAMQTWHIRVTNQAGNNLNKPQAIKRYILASLFFGASFLWALLDREGFYLHDRLAGTRLILAK